MALREKAVNEVLKDVAAAIANSYSNMPGGVTQKVGMYKSYLRVIKDSDIKDHLKTVDDLRTLRRAAEMYSFDIRGGLPGGAENELKRLTTFYLKLKKADE